MNLKGHHVIVALLHYRCGIASYTSPNQSKRFLYWMSHKIIIIALRCFKCLSSWSRDILILIPEKTTIDIVFPKQLNYTRRSIYIWVILTSCGTIVQKVRKFRLAFKATDIMFSWGYYHMLFRQKRSSYYLE